MIEVYENIPKKLLLNVEDVLLNKDNSATERLLDMSESLKGKGKERKEDLAWRKNIRRKIKVLINKRDQFIH